VATIDAPRAAKAAGRGSWPTPKPMPRRIAHAVFQRVQDLIITPTPNPIGGLSEQIADGHTGIVAKRADAQALAEAVMRLLDPDLYSHICKTVAASKDQRSMLRFVEACTMFALPAGRNQSAARSRGADTGVCETEFCAPSCATISVATAPARCSSLADRAPCEVSDRTLRDKKTTLAGGTHRSG
jgi:hypothetical protein